MCEFQNIRVQFSELMEIFVGENGLFFVNFCLPENSTLCVSYWYFTYITGTDHLKCELRSISYIFVLVYIKDKCNISIQKYFIGE